MPPPRNPGSLLRVRRLGAIALLSAGSAMALNPSYALSQYGHANWTYTGTPLTETLLALAQTSDGPLWIGTEHGLFRFDGVALSAWKLTSGDLAITALAAGSEGGLWIGTRTGLFYWDRRSLHPIGLNKSLLGAGISAIHVDHAGAVWAGTVGFGVGGLCRVAADRSQCDAVEPLNGQSIFSLFEDRGGTLWAGGTKAIYTVNASTPQPYAAYDASAGISGITQWNGSIVWTDARNGVQRLATGKIERISLGIAANAHARVLLSDREGSLWIGTMEEGLIHIHQGRIDRYTRADGLSGNTVFAVFEDREGNVWTATDRGLDRFRDLPVVTFSKREGLSEDTAGAVYPEKSGGIWIGTTNGLNLLQGNRISIFDRRNGLRSNAPTSLFEDSTGTLWVDSASGLAFGTAGRFSRFDLPGNQTIRSVTAATEDANGDVWLSDAERGLIRLRNRQVKEIISLARFNNKKPTALALNRVTGEFVLGFLEGGVASYRENGPMRWYTETDGLGRGQVTDLYVDPSGAAWIATGGGLTRLTNGRMTTLTAKNGLPCEKIHALVADDDGALWLNTACGLVRIPPQDLTAWSSSPQMRIRPRTFDSTDGMRVRSLAGYFRLAGKSSDGRLWFPVFDGMAIVDPRHLPRNPLPPPVAVDRILTDGTAHSPLSDLQLPPGTRDLEIDYTAFSFVDPSRLRFRYKLEGYDPEWNEAKGRRQAFYSHLPPKRYRFRVIASNNDDVWNETGATLDFSIQPAFYQTGWFRVCLLAAVFGSFWLLYRYRLRRLTKEMTLRFNERMDERTRIARSLHDDLLQGLSGLGLQMEGLAKTIEPGSLREQLRHFRREAERLMHEAREMVTNLRLPVSEPGDFGAALRRLGEQVVGGGAIRFSVHSAMGKSAIPPQLHDPLLRIVQEALRNILQHASASEIHVDLSFPKSDKLKIRIADNGCGFDLENALHKPRHWGLTNMRERAQDIGAEFHVTTGQGRGTQIEISVPIHSRG